MTIDVLAVGWMVISSLVSVLLQMKKSSNEVVFVRFKTKLLSLIKENSKD